MRLIFTALAWAVTANIILSLTLVGPLQLINGELGLSHIGVSDSVRLTIFGAEWIALSVGARLLARKSLGSSRDLTRFTVAFAILFPISTAVLFVIGMFLTMFFSPLG